MKKSRYLLLIVSVFFLSIQLNAQCVVDFDCEDPEGDGEVCPQELPNAIEATPYDESLTIITAPDLEGASIHHMELLAVNNIPPGMEYNCLDNDCNFYPEEPKCAQIVGTPDIGSYGEYEMEIVVEVFVSILGFPVSIGNIEESIIVVIEPKVSSDFSMSSLICLDDIYLISYEGNATANADYTWNFDDALILTGSGQGPYQVKWNSVGAQTVSLSVYEDDFYSPFTENNFTVVNCTDVEEIYASQMAIYPNPSDDYIVIEFDQELINDRITIIDLSGRVVIQQKVDKEQFVSIDINTLPKGLYLVQTNYLTQKLIVQ